MKKHTTKTKPKEKYRAYCFRSGHIEFQSATAQPPAGAITIGVGPKKLLMDTVRVLARESRPSKPGGKDTFLLVPGIPEAETDKAAEKALDQFYHEVSRRLKPKPVPGPYEVSVGQTFGLTDDGDKKDLRDVLFIRVANPDKINAPFPKIATLDLTLRDNDPRSKGMFTRIRPEELKATAQLMVDAANAATKEPESNKIRVCPHGRGYKAFLNGDKKKWEFGETAADAVYKLIISFQPILGITIVHDHTKI